VLSTLRYVGAEYRAYLEGGPSYARKMNRSASPAVKPVEPAGAAPGPAKAAVTP
jgi:NADH-quinone oxidoreductase subunit F/NADP-reducing hydrogenase subunit HndC